MATVNAIRASEALGLTDEDWNTIRMALELSHQDDANDDEDSQYAAEFNREVEALYKKLQDARLI